MLHFKYLFQVNILVILLPFLFLQTANSQNVSLTIPLNKTLSWADKELYGNFTTLNATSTLQVNFALINKNVSFIIFQVHSHLFNVTLYNNTLTRTSTVVGTNVGLYSSVTPKPDTFFIYNQNNVDLKLYISVHGYEVTDPIPGGCNMEFSTPISPYIRTYINKDFVLVDLTAPKESKDTNCKTMDGAVVMFYKMFLPQTYFDVDTYFDGVKRMLTLDNIMEYGEFIPENGEHMRRRLAAYPGTGTVYVAVAYSNTNKSAYSVYVPDTTYGCDPLAEGDCDVLDDTISRILCAALLFIGLFVCYFGHHFFKTEMFLVGLLSGVVVTYIVISLIAVIDRPALLGASLLSGICFGAIWLLFWWFYGIPIFAVFLATLNVGFLFAAIIYQGLPGGLVALQVDFNFWTLFIMIMLLTSLMLVSMTFLSNILCCVILGSYAAVFSVDYSVGSNLKYIVINTVRRAVVPKFNRAVLSAPYGWRALQEVTHFITMTFLSNILCCVILGSYTAVFSVDYSVGSNLKYIIINAVRRAVVPKINRAVLLAPYGWRDALVSLLWVALALTGFLIQHYHNRGRPPFPPPPRCVRATMPGLSYGAIGRNSRRAPTSPSAVVANNETAPLLA